MKYFPLILLYFLPLYGQLQRPSYRLPQDLNHFIYFLEKEFSKKHRDITIISHDFDQATLGHKIIKNTSSHFDIFIPNNISFTQIIKALALHSHINIYLCQKIEKSAIYFEKDMIKSSMNLSEKALLTLKQTVALTHINKADKSYLLQLKKQCKAY